MFLDFTFISACYLTRNLTIFFGIHINNQLTKCLILCKKFSTYVRVLCSTLMFWVINWIFHKQIHKKCGGSETFSFGSGSETFSFGSGSHISSRFVSDNKFYLVVRAIFGSHKILKQFFYSVNFFAYVTSACYADYLFGQAQLNFLFKETPSKVWKRHFKVMASK